MIHTLRAGAPTPYSASCPRRHAHGVEAAQRDSGSGVVSHTEIPVVGGVKDVLVAEGINSACPAKSDSEGMPPLTVKASYNSEPAKRKLSPASARYRSRFCNGRHHLLLGHDTIPTALRP